MSFPSELIKLYLVPTSLQSVNPQQSGQWNCLYDLFAWHDTRRWTYTDFEVRYQRQRSFCIVLALYLHHHNALFSHSSLFEKPLLSAKCISEPNVIVQHMEIRQEHNAHKGDRLLHNMHHLYTTYGSQVYWICIHTVHLSVSFNVIFDLIVFPFLFVSFKAPLIYFTAWFLS